MDVDALSLLCLLLLLLLLLLLVVVVLLLLLPLLYVLVLHFMSSPVKAPPLCRYTVDNGAL